MLHIDGNNDNKFQPSVIHRNQENKFLKIKSAKKLLKSSPTAIDVLYLIMLHINGDVIKKFQRSIFYISLIKSHFPHSVTD